MRAHKIAAGKIVVDVKLVERLIAAQFPQWAGLPVREVAQDGWDNWTFHLGDLMKVRLPSASSYAEQTDKEARWLPVLAPHLPVAVPMPLAVGVPGEGYPFHWAVYGWLDGDVATRGRITDLTAFAQDSAGFLTALQRIDPTGGPPAGTHNFFRGGSLAVYDSETRASIAALGGRIDAEGALATWEAALAAEWHETPVWVHGDFAAGNLLVNDGRLSGVIDFGSCAVGDPACDLVIAWVFLDGGSRAAFRAAAPGDAAMWARARGWAIWKALLVAAEGSSTNPDERSPLNVIEDLITEHRRGS